MYIWKFCISYLKYKNGPGHALCGDKGYRYDETYNAWSYNGGTTRMLRGDIVNHFHAHTVDASCIAK